MNYFQMLELLRITQRENAELRQRIADMGYMHSDADMAAELAEKGELQKQVAELTIELSIYKHIIETHTKELFSSKTLSRSNIITRNTPMSEITDDPLKDLNKFLLECVTKCD